MIFKLSLLCYPFTIPFILSDHLSTLLVVHLNTSAIQTFFPGKYVSLFILFVGFSRQEYWSCLPFPPVVDWCLSWSSNTVATSCEEPTQWKRRWCWERSKAEGEGVSRGEIVRWHHQLNGHEFDQTLGDSEGQGSLACCSPWDCRESDVSQWLNNYCIPG